MLYSTILCQEKNITDHLSFHVLMARGGFLWYYLTGLSGSQDMVAQLPASARLVFVHISSILLSFIQSSDQIMPLHVRGKGV